MFHDLQQAVQLKTPEVLFHGMCPSHMFPEKLANSDQRIWNFMVLFSAPANSHNVRCTDDFLHLILMLCC